MGVEEVVAGAKAEVKLDRKTAIFEDGRKLTADDLKTPQDPEEFTKRYIIEKVFSILDVGYEAGERHFRTTDGIRKVDYEARSKDFKFLVEAKAINDDLYKRRDGAVEQIKGLFRLAEVKDNYSFGVATDGLRWIFLNPDGEEIGNFSLRDDFPKIKGFITGKRDVRIEKKQAEISKRFYQWYNALLHGGSYRDLKGKQRKIPKESCLVESVLNVPQEEDREEIAQVFINRLIFIKFLQGKGLIKEDVLGHLTSLSQDVLDLKLRQLFFSILNTEVDKRVDPDPKFAEIPYLNGSLFTRSKPEVQNPDYRINAEVLHEVIKFLDTFRFVSEIETAEESIDPEILGYIFERAMTATDRKGTGAYYTPKYITHYICENTIYPYILDRARDYLKKEKGYKEEELPKDFNDILKLRSLTLSDIYGKVVQRVTVCDLACGSGAFLLASADILFDIYAKIEDSLGQKGKNPDISLKKVILQNNIYGVDINHKGVEISKLRLWLWMAKSYNLGGKVEALPNIEYNIRAGNSLVGYVDIGKFKEAKVSMDDYLGLEIPVMDLIKERDELLKDYKFASGEEARELKKKIEDVGDKIKRRLDIHLFQDMKLKKIDISPEEFAKLEVFHWGYEFHKVFENDKSGFGVIIGNPPYFSIATLSKEEKNYLKRYYSETFAGNSDILYYFFARSCNLSGKGGYVGYISARYFQEAKYAAKLRTYLSNNAHLVNFVDFMNYPVFGQDVNVLTSISVLKKEPPNENSTTMVLQITDDTCPPENVSGAILNAGDSLFERFESKSPNFSDEDWRFLSPNLKKLEESFKSNSIPLGDIATIVKSMETGKNEILAPSFETIEKFQIEKELIHPVAKSGSILRYEFEEEDKGVIWTDGIDLSEYPKLESYLTPHKEVLAKRHDIISRKVNWWELSNPRNAKLFLSESPRILVPFMATGNKFCVDTEKHLNDGGDLRGIFFNKQSRNSPYYICAILNSLSAEKYHKTHSKLKRGGYYEYYGGKLSEFPIRCISFTTPEDERASLVSELRELYTESNFPEILSRVESCLPKDAEGNFTTEKEKSDVIHDLLGFLAERMMDLNKQKQAEIKVFHTWLENYIGIKIDEMSVKTQVRAFYDRSWDEYYKVLKRSKGKLELKIEGNDAHDTIKEAFDDTMSKLTPLFDRIQETDELIDRIVYKLYGLTKEEIKVVECG